MWTTLERCRKGDLIRARFLGDSDIESSSNYTWHVIYNLEEKSNGKIYVAIEDYGSRELSGLTEVYKKP